MTRGGGGESEFMKGDSANKSVVRHEAGAVAQAAIQAAAERVGHCAGGSRALRNGFIESITWSVFSNQEAPCICGHSHTHSP